MKFIRYILIVLVPAYYLFSWSRNKLYDWGILGSAEYNVPVICVGNLNVGGTGKTPMIEHLITLFSEKYELATLSRGYKRKTSGFVLAGPNDSAETIGDEPFQFYNKFNDIIVAVDADRRRGISSLLALPKPPEIILLDDAFQHRRVKAGFNLLLTSYNNLFVDDLLLPTGDLREPISGRKRAHAVVVTKCPPDITREAKERIKLRLKLGEEQDLFFSYIRYSDKIKGKNGDRPLTDLAKHNFSLLTGIADASHLKNYLMASGLNFEHLEFGDHHDFSKIELEAFREKELILTTEKDYVRLLRNYTHDNIWFLPIGVELDRPDAFYGKLNDFIRN